MSDEYRFQTTTVLVRGELMHLPPGPDGDVRVMIKYARLPDGQLVGYRGNPGPVRYVDPQSVINEAEIGRRIAASLTKRLTAGETPPPARLVEALARDIYRDLFSATP